MQFSHFVLLSHLKSSLEIAGIAGKFLFFFCKKWFFEQIGLVDINGQTACFTNGKFFFLFYVFIRDPGKIVIMQHRILMRKLCFLVQIWDSEHKRKFQAMLCSKICTNIKVANKKYFQSCLRAKSLFHGYMFCNKMFVM